MENDDIDLRPYMIAVVKQWRWIVATVVLTCLVTVFVLYLLPKTYTATASALIFIRQTGSQVGTNEPVLNIETIDVNARRLGIQALAESSAIEMQLPPEVVQQVAPAGYRQGQLAGKIDARLDGDLLSISANADTPEKAKALADAWTNTYIQYAQPLFTDQHSEIRFASNSILPYEPSGPSLVRNTLVAGLAGLVLATLATVLNEVFRTSAVSPKRAPQKRPASSTYPTSS
jgi:uncharacterized protein involved in exopolysaccharide biosynthesis